MSRKIFVEDIFENEEEMKKKVKVKMIIKNQNMSKQLEMLVFEITKKDIQKVETSTHS